MTVVASGTTWEVDGYDHVAELGHGEAGLLVRARHRATGADVCVRYVARKLCQAPGFLGRYRSEVAALRLIEAPNVAAVYGLVERGDIAAVLSELVDGVSLRELVRDTGGFKPAAAMHITYSVLLGLTAVHDYGIVHRALRPENILFDGSGTAKVVDIGLVRSDPNGLPANPFYAAPELWFGDPAKPTADVFAATAILYECLTGQAPRGANGAYLGRSGHSPDAAVAALGPDLAGGPLGTFLAHGLATEPTSRFADARSAANHLNAVGATMFGSGWYDIGATMLRRRLSRRPRRSSPVAVPHGPAAPPCPTAAPTSPAVGRAVVGPASLTDDRDGRLPFRAPVWTSDAAWAPVEPDEWLPADPPAPARPAPLLSAAPPPSAAPVPPPPPAPPSSPPPVAVTAPPPAGRAGPADEDEPFDPWDLDAPRESIPGSRSHRAASGWGGRTAVIVGLILALAAGTVLALKATVRPGPTPGPADPVAAPPTGAASSTSEGGVDAGAPVAPTRLRVTGRSMAGVTLDWAPATDDVGVAGYAVLRDGAPVGSTAAPGFMDTGLASDTRYTYTVTAVDAAGNTSPPSAPVTATTLRTPDLSRPVAPTGLRITGATSSRITLAWADGHDDTGVAGYHVYRDGRKVASVPRPGFTDAGLAPDRSYRYKVRAFDTSNNLSAESITVTGSTRPASSTSAPATSAPPPVEEPRIESVSVTAVLSGCTVSVQATVSASAPMTVDLSYTVDGEMGTKVIVFTAGGQPQVVPLATLTDSDGGTAVARVEDRFDLASWPACE